MQIVRSGFAVVNRGYFGAQLGRNRDEHGVTVEVTERNVIIIADIFKNVGGKRYIFIIEDLLDKNTVISFGGHGRFVRVE